MASAVRDKLQTLGDLREALQHDELVLHYQPVVAVTGGRVVGVEALLRWQHPRRGLLAPGEFLPVAEEAGLLVEIGHWVLRRALLDASRWPAEAALNVNLSVRELLQPGIETVVREVLRETGFPAERLTLEVTESALMSELTAGSQSLSALRALGVKIALDDFGTGYSSFSYLSRLPLDTLKLDRSFVLDLATGQGRAVVSGMIRLAHGLGMPVVAEGVETAEQLTALCALGCDFVQGFHLGRPVPSPDFQPSTVTPP